MTHLRVARPSAAAMEHLINLGWMVVGVVLIIIFGVVCLSYLAVVLQGLLYAAYLVRALVVEWLARIARRPPDKP